MFPECVMKSRGVALDHSPAPFGRGRHIAVTLPGYALELIRIADVRLQPREVGKRLPSGGRILFRERVSAYHRSLTRETGRRVP